MAVRLADLAAFLHVGEHVNVGRPIVPQFTAADGRVLGESLADEGGIFQELRKFLRDVGQAALALALERAGKIGAEIGERVWHGRLLQSMIWKKPVLGLDPRMEAGFPIRSCVLKCFNSCPLPPGHYSAR